MGEKRLSGGYGDLIDLIPCEKTVMNSCKVPKRLAAALRQTKTRAIFLSEAQSHYN